MSETDCLETITTCAAAFNHSDDTAESGPGCCTNECPGMLAPHEMRNWMQTRLPPNKLTTITLHRADLPASLWQCIYRHTNTQHDICNGMRVCKMLEGALPELLVGATLRAPAALVCLPAIQASFINLILLEVLMHLPDHAPKPRGNTDLASLSFPHLRELRLTNNVTDRLVFDEAHYPQLRRLCIERTAETGFVIQDLTLQLPRLLTFELEGVCVESLDILSACLTSEACPRLRRFSAVSVGFKTGEMAPWEMQLDVPWLERFELQLVDLNMLQLRAPRLTELHLINCIYLGSVVLLPDGQPPVEDVESDSSDAAVAVPDSTCAEDVETAIRMREAMANLGLHANGPSPLVAIRPACSAQRIDLTICNLDEWQTTEGYAAFVADLRIRYVNDQGYDGIGEGSQVSEEECPWQFVDEYGRPRDNVFEGRDSDYDDGYDYDGYDYGDQ